MYHAGQAFRRVLGVLLLLGITGAVVAAPVAGAVPATADHGQQGQVDRTDGDIRSIEYGEVVSGSIDTGDPQSAAYRGYHEPITFDGSAGDTLHIQMFGGSIAGDRGFEGPTADTDPYLILVGPDGEVIARNDDSDYGLNARIQGIVLPADGEYTIVATSYDANQTFDYTLRLQNENRESADLRSIERNSTATGAIDKDDPRDPERRGFHEPVTFDGSAGERVSIDMGSRTGDTYLQLLAPDGTVIAENDDNDRGLNSSIETTLPEDGEYTIVATSFGEADTFEYELSLSVGTGSGGDGTDLRAIEVGETRQGALDEGDPQARFMRGYFEPVTFAGQSGQSVTIDMTSNVGDTYLYLYGPSGNRLAENDDFEGLNSRIQLRLPEDGEYTIIATSFDEEATFPYELTLAANGTDGEPGTDLRNISYGETRDGEIDTSDPYSDSYRGNYEPVTFDGGAGDNVTVEMTSQDDTYLILLGPDGTVIAENDDYQGLDSRIQATLPEDGEYTVIATSFDESATFPYQLTLREGGGTTGSATE
jgi:hypothetical protein